MAQQRLYEPSHAGIDALSDEPSRVERNGAAPLAGESVMRNWDERATVRTHPRRLLEVDDIHVKEFFSPDLVAIVHHPAVADRGHHTVRALLLQHLYGYLDFTSRLEHDLVNEVARRIAQGIPGLSLSHDMRLDAHRLYCDEAYHALASADIKYQIEMATGVLDTPRPLPSFLVWVREAREDLPAEIRSMTDVFFAVVSETLISRTLTRVPRDQRVNTVVRDVIADHARDEAVHHAYFSDFMEIAWPQISASHRALIGPLLPHCVLAFLWPEYEATAQALVREGWRESEAQRIVEDIRWQAGDDRSLASMASATLRLFRRVGVFDDPVTEDAFASAGLIK
jgi:hypothetical protein